MPAAILLSAWQEVELREPASESSGCAGRLHKDCSAQQVTQAAQNGRAVLPSTTCCDTKPGTPLHGHTIQEEHAIKQYHSLPPAWHLDGAWTHLCLGCTVSARTCAPGAPQTRAGGSLQRRLHAQTSPLGCPFY